MSELVTRTTRIPEGKAAGIDSAGEAGSDERISRGADGVGGIVFGHRTGGIEGGGGGEGKTEDDEGDEEGHGGECGAHITATE